MNESDVHSCIIAFINGPIDFEIVFQVSFSKEMKHVSKARNMGNEDLMHLNMLNG